MSITLADDRPYYTNLDEVCGAVKYCRDLAVEGTVLLVHLMGVVKVVQMEWYQNLAAYRMVRTEYPFLDQVTQVDIDMKQCQSTFAFRLPSLLQPRQCPIGDLHHMELPPSMHTKRVDGRLELILNCSQEWEITYQIRVVLVHLESGAELGHVVRPIHFLPTTRIAQLLPDATKSETSLCPAKKLTNFLGQDQGSLAAILEEGSKLTTSGMSPAVTTSLPLSFQYEGINPPKITKITMTLLARTYKKTRHAPLDYQNESCLTVSRLLEEVSNKTEGLITWSASNTELHTYHQKINLPVKLLQGTDAVVLPSFESCLISGATT